MSNRASAHHGADRKNRRGRRIRLREERPSSKTRPAIPTWSSLTGQRARFEEAFARFCSVFPDMFYMESRGRNYFNTNRDQGRYLSAGYHNVMGFFRDDQPFYELLLDEKQQAKLDQMWREMDFIADAVTRSYVQFAISGTARGARKLSRQ